MTFGDVLLHIDSYPEPTSPAAVEQAVRLVAGLGGKVSALAVRVTFPLEHSRLADLLIGLGEVITEEVARSDAACRRSLEHFTATAKAAGVFGEALLEVSDILTFSEHVALRARTRDLCIVPMAPDHLGQEEVAQAAIFNSGRPVLLLRGGSGPFVAGAFDKVVIAWDGGRSCARAMAEALPMIARARDVRLLNILGEKPVAPGVPSAREAARHLAAHGITATIDEAEAADRKIDVVLDDYLGAQAPDLVVMGAFGHARLREFMLGGATRHMLSHSRSPVLMCH
jgi:nucleotide-binding universal stress UspA family protein